MIMQPVNIICLESSAGGLTALIEFFKHMAPDSGNESYRLETAATPWPLPGDLMRSTLLIALSLCATLPAADLDKAPPALRNDFDRAQAAVVKLLNDFQNAAQKEADHLASDMTKEFKEAMKKGDLDGANAINAKLEEIKNGAWLAAVQRSWFNNVENGDLLAGNLTPVALVGRWSVTTSDGWNDVLLLRDGGKIVSTTDGDLDGTWTITKATVAISCTGDHAFVLSMTQVGVLSGKGGDVTATMKRMR